MVSERVGALGRGWVKVLGLWEEGGGVRMFSREGPHENTAGGWEAYRGGRANEIF